MIATVVGVAVLAVGLLASIALHEVGHLLPAKRFGVRVTQYMVGFGPTLWSTRRGETEYGVKWIPLGGYIRMVGMFPPAPSAARPRRRGWLPRQWRLMIEEARRTSLAEVRPGEESRAFFRLSAPRKLVVMLGGPTMNLLLAAVVFGVLLSVVGTPQLTPQVAAVSQCLTPAASATAAPPACGPTDPPTPAAAAGLRPGDRIVAFDGRAVTSWDQLAGWIRGAAGRPVTLAVDRGGVRQEVTLTPVATPRRLDPQRPDRVSIVGFVGIEPTLAQVRAPLGAVPGRMWEFTGAAFRAVVAIPARMGGIWQAAFGGAQRDVNGPIGIVGIGRIGGEVAAAKDIPLSWKVGDMLGILAALNMSLFIFNLLPLLPLDGGHVAGALFEGARRQVARWRRRPDPGPADVARLLPLAYAVAVVLVGASALLLYADVVNPIRLAG